MPSIMELLCFEKSLNLIRYSIVRIISKVGGHLVCAGKNRRAGPTRDVQYFLVGSLLCHLHWIDGAHCK